MPTRSTSVNAYFDKKLISMVVLTALIAVPVCSILDKNIPINVKKEFIRFLNIWFFLGLAALFWNIFLCSDPPLVGIVLIVKTAWCMGLLSSFFIFLNNIEYMMQVATEHWGSWGGPVLVLAFSFIWLYTVFNFYNQPVDCHSSSGQKLKSKKSPILAIPKETQYMTAVVMLLTATIIFLAYRDIIPNFGKLMVTFLKIWVTWIIMFVVCYYNLFKDNKTPGPGLFKLDLQLLTWVKYWDCFMMTALISFFITAHGSEGHTGYFHMTDYYLFCLVLLSVSVLSINIFRWLGE